MRIYLDGELAGSRPYDSSGIRDSTGPLWIGEIPGRDADFRGLVDEAQLWRRALTGDEIRARMHRPLRGDEPGLMAYFRFDDPAETVIVRDTSSDGHHGRLVDGAYKRGAPEQLVEAYLPGAAVVAAASVTTTTTTTTSVPVMLPTMPMLVTVRDATPA